MAETYHERFIKAVLYLQADLGLTTLKDMARELPIPYMTLYKLMGKAKGYKPTIEQCLIVLRRGGYNANWLFLGKGELKYQESLSAIKLAAAVKRIEEAVAGG